MPLALVHSYPVVVTQSCHASPTTLPVSATSHALIQLASHGVEFGRTPIGAQLWPPCQIAAMSKSFSSAISPTILVPSSEMPGRTERQLPLIGTGPVAAVQR